DSEDEQDDGVRKAGGDISQQAVSAEAAASGVPVSLLSVVPGNEGAARAAAMNLQLNLARIQSESLPDHYEAELEIN
ncbi:hypothetical protein Tco_0645086, partial [Tanacetum coccineum]